ncbi:MAG: mechanosensitive ion channel domain-containing protein [Cyanobacteria bacterium P01_A01_bin.114]
MSDFLQYLQTFANQPFAIKLVEVLVGLFVIGLIFRIIRASLPNYIRNTDTRYRVRKTLAFVSYILMLIFTASVFSESLGQLSIVFGVAGAGVAFALQEVIASFAGWVAISIGQFYKPGDRVQLGGITGDVIDISLLRTTLMECGNWVKADLYNGRIVRIANSFVFKEPVFNYKADFPFLWDEIIIPVKYGCDRTLTEAILKQAVQDIMGEYTRHAERTWEKMVDKYLIENAQVEPAVTLIANDNWMEYTVRYVVDYKQRRVKKHLLFQRILDDIENTEGKVALASATFELAGAPALDVSIDGRQNGLNLR